MDLTLLLWNSLMATLAVAVVCYMASFHQSILFALVMALTLFASLQFFANSHNDRAETMGFIKLLFLLPLGLGSLLAFAGLSEDRQKRSLSWFTHYINIAVAANIFVMIFTPDGDTYRGLLSRFVCLALLVWLLQEMAKKRFQTTHFDAGIFIFRSSPLPWILCHACYRLALLTLPAFDSLNYLLLEPLSLLMMAVLYRLHQKRYPLAFYFGLADTIVVSTLAVISRYPIAPIVELKGPHIGSPTQDQLDLVFVPLQLLVLGFALRAISFHDFKTLLMDRKPRANK